MLIAAMLAARYHGEMAPAAKGAPMAIPCTAKQALANLRR